MLRPISLRHARVITALLLATVASFAQTTKPVTRDQPVLMVDGEFVKEGLKIKAKPATGPGANMQRKENGEIVKGQLDPGDIVTAVEGKVFKRLVAK